MTAHGLASHGEVLAELGMPDAEIERLAAVGTLQLGAAG
jgi:hypothetical protein